MYMFLFSYYVCEFSFILTEQQLLVFILRNIVINF